MTGRDRLVLSLQQQIVASEEAAFTEKEGATSFATLLLLRALAFGEDDAIIALPEAGASRGTATTLRRRSHHNIRRVRGSADCDVRPRVYRARRTAWRGTGSRTLSHLSRTWGPLIRYLTIVRYGVTLGVLSAAATVSRLRSAKKGMPTLTGTFEATRSRRRLVDYLMQIERFVPVDGMRIQRGAPWPRSTPLSSRWSVGRFWRSARLRALAAPSSLSQRLVFFSFNGNIARRAYERNRRLFADHAATAQQLDR